MIILLPLLIILPAILADAEPQHPLLHHLHHQPALLQHYQAAPSLVQHADGRYFAVNAHLQPGQLFQAADGRLFTLATSSLQQVSQAVHHQEQEQQEDEESGAVLAVGRNAEVEEDEPDLIPFTSNSLNSQPDVTLFPNHPLAAVRAVPENTVAHISRTAFPENTGVQTSRTASSEAVTGSFQVISPNRFRFPDRLVPSFNQLVAGRESEAPQNLPELLIESSLEPQLLPLTPPEDSAPLPRTQQQIPAQPELKPFVHTGRPTEIQPSPLRSISPPSPFQPAQFSPRINPLFLQQSAQFNSLRQTTNPSHQFLPLSSTSPHLFSAAPSNSPLLLSSSSSSAQPSPLLLSSSPSSSPHLLSGTNTASSPFLLSSSSASSTSPLLLSQPNGPVYTGYYSFPSAGVNYNF